MPRSYLAHRPDANHREIKSQLMDLGMTIFDSSLSGWSLDLILIWRGDVRFVEIKNPGKASKAQLDNPELMLTESESLVMNQIKRNDGRYIIAFDVQEILDQW